MKKTVIVVGAGRGLGNHIAAEFCRNGFRAVLMARGAAALREYEKEFAAQGFEATGIAADAADLDSLTAAFATVKEKFGTVDALVYNVGITGADLKEGVAAKDLLRHYQADVVGAYQCVQLVFSNEFSQKRGAILFTGGGYGLDPAPDHLPLSVDKAALRALALALHKQLKNRGVFVGTVTVTQSVMPRTPYAPEIIAQKFWELYEQRKDPEIVY